MLPEAELDLLGRDVGVLISSRGWWLLQLLQVLCADPNTKCAIAFSSPTVYRHSYLSYLLTPPPPSPF